MISIAHGAVTQGSVCTPIRLGYTADNGALRPRHDHNGALAAAPFIDASADYTIPGLSTLSGYPMQSRSAPLRNNPYAGLKQLAETTASSAMHGNEIPSAARTNIAPDCGVAIGRFNNLDEFRHAVQCRIAEHNSHFAKASMTHGRATPCTLQEKR